jgi:glycosyltransferase involved in cell wall biosynthesis
MRTAIFHSFMDNIGGAEMVTLTLARGLGADVYTTNVAADKIEKMGFADVLPRIRSIGRVPIRAPLRHQATLWRFSRLNLGAAYDRYIVGGDWAIGGARLNRPCLWYVHSPLNELWEFYAYVRERVVPWWQRPAFDAWVRLNRWLTRRYARGVDAYLSNSENTRRRVSRYYGADAPVAYPPIDVAGYRCGEDGGYWLSVNRLFAHKRVEMQLEAFAAMPERRLVIVGSYEAGAAHFERYRRLVESRQPANVEIRRWVSREELVELYAGCRGFITTSENEDFGMTVVEAMAAGKPVIAPAEGGYLESVRDDETGLLVKGIDAGKLCAAVRRIEETLAGNPLAYRDACRARAADFDAPRFIAQVEATLRAMPDRTLP